MSVIRVTAVPVCRDQRAGPRRPYHILGIRDTKLHTPAKREGNGRSRRADRVERAMAESEGEVVFSSVQEELEYWKERALEFRQR